MVLIKLVNSQTGEETEREMTLDELEENEKLKAKWEAEVVAEEAKSNAKAALLEKLGITKEEAKLLLS